MKQTNGMSYSALTPEEKEKFRETYNNHPLVNFIDWQAYYNSSDGNALHFVRCIDKYTDEEGRRVFVLDKINEDDLDYKLIFVCEENSFYKIPDDAA